MEDTQNPFSPDYVKTDNQIPWEFGMDYEIEDILNLQSISKELAETIISHHGGWVKTLEVKTLNAILFDALVSLEISLLESS